METGLDIFFVDGKNSFQRIISLASALFWTWLEVMFLKFFFIFAFGIVGYILGSSGAFYEGSFEFSYETILNNVNLIEVLIPLLVLIIFILRVPIYYKKEIKKRTTNHDKTSKHSTHKPKQ